ncbi:transporter substrate-binding domain-containing protein [uncultured Ferrimonas sp.]|uniref:ATP-binding protein n=1 Tax=uncultured Ferrimonas sp. TaxID=432640 RepID=UPI0026392E69|nr:transporter substrate-binding domain-containing protein [uncultured Ferrimonas sp.]
MKILLFIYACAALFWAPWASAAQPETVVFGVHSNTAPLEWRNNGVDQGFHVELMRRLGQLTNKRIVVRRHSFQQLVKAVSDKHSDIDVIAVVSPIGRSRLLAQSDPIYATHARAYTRQGQALVNRWEDLANKRVAIKVGSFVDVYLKGNQVNFERIDVDLYETGFQMIEADEVDVVLAESFVARRLLPFYPQVRSASDALIFGAFNFVANERNRALMAELNNALRQLKLSGEYDQLVRKWFGTGREKVDLASTQNHVTALAMLVATLAVIGMISTWGMTGSLRKRTVELNNELSHRRSAERKLSHLSQQFQRMLDGMPHGIALYTRDQCVWSNGKHHDLLQDLHLQDQQQPLQIGPLVQRALRSGQPLFNALEHQQQHWQLQLHPISNTEVVALLEDVSEQHRLRQANEQASRLASLGELSAGVAHEINNPTGLIVHAIALFQAALEDLEPAIASYQQQDPYWDIAGLAPRQALQELHFGSDSITEAARRISRIVNDLKQYAQPQQLNHQSLLVNDVVQVALRLTANQVKRFHLTLVLTEDNPRILGDSQQLQQVLINFIQNACHAMSCQDGQLQLRTQVEGDQVVLSVSDNGCGMDSATIERIKEPFFTTRRADGGSGLGLSVCSRIINEHQGQWQIQSQPQQGTTMVLRFKKGSEL